MTPQSEKTNIKKWLMQNFFSLASIGLTIANVFLAYKLSPIISDLRDIGSRVSAVEERFNKHEDNNTKLFDSINNKLDSLKDISSEIKSRVSRIEGKLE